MDEYQASFLLTLMKNTPVVKRFKLDLVLQFKAMREKEISKLESKLADAKSLKTYKYGQVSLRKYLRDSGKKILEEEAWQELEDLGIIETRYSTVKTRHLIDSSFGSQTYKTLSFDAAMLDTVL
jgi:phage regulator Rha-like protein